MIISWIVSGMKRSVHWPDLYRSPCFNAFADVQAILMPWALATYAILCVYRQCTQRPREIDGNDIVETGQVFRLSRQVRQGNVLTEDGLQICLWRCDRLDVEFLYEKIENIG